MSTFLSFILLLVCLGILIRIFWIQLAFIGAILLILLGIIVCAGVTAITFEMIHAICTDGTWTGFSTYFKYAFAFYTFMTVVYMLIIGEITKMILSTLRKFIRKN